MAAIKLMESPLPKSGSGRKAQELNTELVTALAKALTDNAVVKDPTSNEDRPRALGPEETYPTTGKAGSAGRRYANAVIAAMEGEPKVKVNVYADNRNDKGEYVAPFKWRIYIPLAESASA